jgi:hypothetical protein
LSKLQKNPSRWLTVTTFAIAMAWVEAAVVYYLRTMIGRIEPYQTNPLPIVGGLGPVEMVREAATMLMLLAVGILAGQTWRKRFGYTAIAFGVWDIFYYVFLKAMCGWPHSLFDWDILFLLPLPWWGPVLAPVLISLLMILWGTLVDQIEPRPGPRLNGLPWWLLNWVGIATAMYVFMADSIRVSGGGVDALRNLLPAHFQWPLFSTALLLLSAPVVGNVLELVRQRASLLNPARFGVRDEQSKYQP